VVASRTMYRWVPDKTPKWFAGGLVLISAAAAIELAGLSRLAAGLLVLAGCWCLMEGFTDRGVK
jgi:hypothetical protein